MSLRYASRVAFQAGMRAAQVMKEGVSKTLKDSATQQQRQRARKFSAGGATINKASAGTYDLNKLKQSEESLRTVLFLSCWGPN